MENENIETVIGYVESDYDAIEKIETSVDPESGHTFIDVFEQDRETRTVIRRDDLENGDEEAMAVAFVTWVEEILETPTPLAAV